MASEGREPRGTLDEVNPYEAMYDLSQRDEQHKGRSSSRTNKMNPQKEHNSTNQSVGGFIASASSHRLGRKKPAYLKINTLENTDLDMASRPRKVNHNHMSDTNGQRGPHNAATPKSKKLNKASD